MATRKKRIPIITWVQFAGIVTITISLTLLVGFAYKITTYDQIKQQAQALQDKLERVQTEHHELELRKAYVQTDAYVEKVAREDLNYGRFGDSVVMVKHVPGVASPPTPQPAEQVDSRDGPQWQAWYDLLFGESPEAYGF
jgi:cell division protein FtsB